MVLPLDPAKLAEGVRIPELTGVVIAGKLGEASTPKAGTRALSVFVVNLRSAGDRGRRDAQMLFQVSLEVRYESGFLARPTLRRGTEFDDKIASLQYRHVCEYAVGHGVAIEAASAIDGKITTVMTTWLPRSEVRRVTTSDALGEGLAVEQRMGALADLGARSARCRASRSVPRTYAGPRRSPSHPAATTWGVPAAAVRPRRAPRDRRRLCLLRGQQYLRLPLHARVIVAGVEVEFFIHVDATGQNARMSPSSFFTYSWPRRDVTPRLYYDARADTADASSTHAKCVIVDDREVLITSANFTGRARSAEHASTTPAGRGELGQPLSHPREPRRTIGFVERHAGRHLGARGGVVQIVSIEERLCQRRGERSADVVLPDPDGPITTMITATTDHPVASSRRPDACGRDLAPWPGRIQAASLADCMYRSLGRRSSSRHGPHRRACLGVPAVAARDVDAVRPELRALLVAGAADDYAAPWDAVEHEADAEADRASRTIMAIDRGHVLRAGS